MLRRNLLHARRYPSLTLNLLLTPVVLLLLFVYVFGDVMSAGIAGGGADRSDYIADLVPGLLLMTIGSTTIGTAGVRLHGQIEASSPASAPWRSTAAPYSSDTSSAACSSPS